MQSADHACEYTPAHNSGFGGQFGGVGGSGAGRGPAPGPPRQGHTLAHWNTLQVSIYPLEIQSVHSVRGIYLF